jgi:hypothetical protein
MQLAFNTWDKSKVMVASETQTMLMVLSDPEQQVRARVLLSCYTVVSQLLHCNETNTTLIE